MLSYQHGFHAGGFADIHKHALLALVLSLLRQGQRPLLYVETHAGRERYRLDGPQALKTGEFRDGIARIWERPDLPADLTPMMAEVRRLNGSRGADGRPRLDTYPGSAFLAKRLLRPKDRLRLTELHPQEVRHLRQALAGDRRVRVMQADGYATAARAWTEEFVRPVLFIDPSFEVKREFSELADWLETRLPARTDGLLLLWYPLLPDGAERALRDRMSDRHGPVLRLELARKEAGAGRRLTGTGLMLVNVKPALAERAAALHRDLAPLLDASIID